MMHDELIDQDLAERMASEKKCRLCGWYRADADFVDYTLFDKPVKFCKFCSLVIDNVVKG